MKKPVMILGATSSIARGIAFALASKGFPLFLAGRKTIELERMAADLRIRYGIEVFSGFFDVDYPQNNEKFFKQALTRVNGFSGIVVAIGEFGNHEKAVQEFSEAHKIINRNFTFVSAILSIFANYFEKEQEGFILTLSSLAAEKGNKKDYVYGSAKAALNLFMEGLQDRFSSTQVHILTVKMDPVDTEKRFDGKLISHLLSPDYVGKAIVKALEKKREQTYLPWFSRYLNPAMAKKFYAR